MRQLFCDKYCSTLCSHRCLGLTRAALPYVLQFANRGVIQALEENSHLREGGNVCFGQITYRAIAEDLNDQYCPIEAALEICL